MRATLDNLLEHQVTSRQCLIMNLLRALSRFICMVTLRQIALVGALLSASFPAIGQSGLHLPDRGEPGLDASFARGWLAPEYDRFGFTTSYHWRPRSEWSGPHRSYRSARPSPASPPAARRCLVRTTALPRPARPARRPPRQVCVGPVRRRPWLSARSVWSGGVAALATSASVRGIPHRNLLWSRHGPGSTSNTRIPGHAR